MLLAETKGSKSYRLHAIATSVYSNKDIETTNKSYAHFLYYYIKVEFSFPD